MKIARTGAVTAALLISPAARAEQYLSNDFVGAMLGFAVLAIAILIGLPIALLRFTKQGNRVAARIAFGWSLLLVALACLAVHLCADRNQIPWALAWSLGPALVASRAWVRLRAAG